LVEQYRTLGDAAGFAAGRHAVEEALGLQTGVDCLREFAVFSSAAGCPSCLRGRSAGATLRRTGGIWGCLRDGAYRSSR
jgi:hypothetical protein